MRLLLFVLLLAAASAQGAETSEQVKEITLLCIADQSVGFRYNEARDIWEKTAFDVSRKKYTFSKSDITAYEFKEFGDDWPIAHCDKINEKGFAQCSGFSDLTLNVDSLRYQIVYSVGYVAAPDAIDKPGNTPHIEIGECSRL